MKTIYQALILSVVLTFVSCTSNQEIFEEYLQSNNVKSLRTLLQKDSDVSMYTIAPDSIAYIFHCVSNKNYEILKLLTNYGFKSDSIFNNSISLIGHAIQEKDTFALTTILQSSDQLAKPCYKSLPPLHYSISEDDTMLTEHLISHGAMMDLLDGDGKNPIFYVQSEKVLKTLQRNGYKLQNESNTDALSNDIIYNYLNQKHIIEFPKNQRILKSKKEVSFQTALNRIAQRDYKPLGNTWSDHFERLPKKHFYVVSDSTSLIQSDYNPFLHAVELAYYEHRPLIISPDMIWLLICQGVSQHIALNSEEFRDLLVEHKGKKNIVVARDNINIHNKKEWASLAHDFASSITPNKEDSLYQIMQSQFTTTGPVEQVAYNITYLDVMSNYYMYIFVTCGIPSITIEGTPEDWQKIYEQVDFFRKYKLDWWLDELKPCLKEFVSASNGNYNHNFWEGILKDKQIESCTADRLITGWINNLLPYIYSYRWDSLNSQHDLYITRNPNIYKKKNWPLETQNILPGVSIVPFVWDNGIKKRKLEFIAGFVGIEQNKETKALRPKIGYGIMKKQIIDNKIFIDE